MNPKIYQSGIHFGEEKIIIGNDRSGVIYFSGCHLKCSFCYTPETSKLKLGTESTNLVKDFCSLMEKGAKNLNLITVTHIWPTVKSSLIEFKKIHPKTPIVLKVSGMQGKNLAQSMLDQADVVVFDYKFALKESALRYNLPECYPLLTREAIAQSGTPTFQDGKLIKGALVRHLVMPNELDNSKAVLKNLREIDFKGPINLMTRYFDPTRKKIIESLSDEELLLLLNHLTGHTGLILVNGKALKEKYNVAV